MRGRTIRPYRQSSDRTGHQEEGWDELAHCRGLGGATAAGSRLAQFPRDEPLIRIIAHRREILMSVLGVVRRSTTRYFPSEAHTHGAPGLAPEPGAPRAPIPSHPRHGHSSVRERMLVWSPHAEWASNPSVCRKG